MPLKLPKNIPALYAQEKTPSEDQMVYARLFALGSAATWLVTEFNPQDKVIYCYADLYGQGKQGGAEWGYSSIREMEELKFLGIPRIEVDLHFTPKKFSECVTEDGRIL